jgi:hypothetical protein
MNATQRSKIGSVATKNEQIVEMALQSQELKDGTFNHITLAKLADFTDEEVEFVKIVWDAIFNNKWLYLSLEIESEWLCYPNIFNTLKDQYRENIDFKLNGGICGLCPVLNITSECLEKLLANSESSKSRQYHKLFIKTERLAKVMSLTIKQSKLQRLRENMKRID